jgi:thiamine-monophosphate kinase
MQSSVMAAETDFITQLRTIATHDAARGLLDDAAVISVGGQRLVITHDMLVEGVHFLPDDPPETVAWKLVAVNASDLAAKGAKPLYAVMGYTLTGDADWDRRFAEGLKTVLDAFGIALIGGDTVSGKERAFGMTLIGSATGPVPSRSRAQVGDALYVTGTIGDAGAGLALARAGQAEPSQLLAAYRSPQPHLEAGALLTPHVTAMMDVSDGLLIDALRMAEASGVAAKIDLGAIPLSEDYQVIYRSDRPARLSAATAGDDYQLLFTTSLPLPNLPCPVTRIGEIVSGSGLILYDEAGEVPLPEKLGWLHEA